MRLIFKIGILLPLLVTNVSCSSSKKISFQCDNFTFDTYYNDSYFNSNNRELNEGIALASHAMALATFNGDEDYTARSKYLNNLWQKEGFSNIWMSDSFYTKPETDSIGFGISSKHITDFTVIAIAVRGGNYDGEWASNFTIGETGDAQGFNEASDKVVEEISNYITKFNIEGHIKIWISGYSRAAITSNMTAGKILKKLSVGEYLSNKVTYTSDDFYAYCFEPPMGVQISLDSARSDLFHGIHNFLNYNDFVPLVAPFEWGFTRYGTDHYYPDRINDIYFDATEREKIISLYHFTYGAQDFANYSVDNWKFFDVGEKKAAEHNLPRESINPSQGRFSRTLIHEVAINGFMDRGTYAHSIQNGLRDLLATTYGLNEDIGKIDLSSLVDIIFEYDFIKTLILELEEERSADFAMDVQMLFLQIFGANEENFDAVNELYYANFALFFLLPQAFNIRKDILAQLLYRDNAMGIAVGHMPEVSYSFLCACTHQFMGNKACKFNDGSYETLHIQSPKSFSLFEKGLKKTVFSYKDGIMSSDCVSAEKFADGSINIYLPKNGKYEYIADSLGVYLGHNDPLEGEIPTNSVLSPTAGEF